MSYLRVKWIKGHPYLYEQASYRVGSQVKTKHIRYIGQFGFTGSPGFLPPANLTPIRKQAVDTEMTKLSLGSKYPYEREILRTFLYSHNFQFTVKPLSLKYGQVEISRWGIFIQELDKFGLLDGAYGRVKELALIPESNAFTWMHEVGHALELQDWVVNKELDNLRAKFVDEVGDAYNRALFGRIEEKQAFVDRFGELIDIRRDFFAKLEPDYDSLIDRAHSYNLLERLKAGRLDEGHFDDYLELWVEPEKRLNDEEIFADSVASVIIDPKLAFKAHNTPLGKKYLEKVYTALYAHFEEKYNISLSKPQQGE